MRAYIFIAEINVFISWMFINSAYILFTDLLGVCGCVEHVPNEAVIFGASIERIQFDSDPTGTAQ